MKILIVRMYPNFLNIKNYNCQELGLAKALIRKGNTCDIVLYTDQQSYEEDILFDKDNKKIHIYYLKAKNVLKNAIFERKLYEIAKKYDVVQTAEYDQIGNVKLKKKVRNKLVIYHGPYESNYTKGYKKKCLISDLYYIFHRKYKNTPCLAKSELAKKFLIEKGFNNVTTVGVGLDDDKFINMNTSNEQLKKLLIEKKDNNLKYLLYIGKIEDRRNIFFLIDILKKISMEKEYFKLILVGKGEDKYIEKCWEYAKRNNVYDKIVYIEKLSQEELPQLYENSDLFLLPTKYEIFGMVILEAMYWGVPVITTMNGGSSVLIKDNENGFICGINDLDKWVNIINLIDSNDEYRNKIKFNASVTIKNSFRWEKLAERFLKEYQI